MMIGNNDRQTMREKVPPPPPPNGAPKANAPAPLATPASPPVRPHPEQQSSETVERHLQMTPEQARQAAYCPWDFHSEKWELAYIKRIDATIAALESAGVPVIWVGLASQRGTKSSQNSSYLNELYRSRAEKAGIIYVDIWDAFVDEAGRYSPQGPDYEGQIRRLRAGDGVYFTKFGARKLAHYVEREVQRIVGNKGLPVALSTLATKRDVTPYLDWTSIGWIAPALPGALPRLPCWREGGNPQLIISIALIILRIVRFTGPSAGIRETISQ